MQHCRVGATVKVVEDSDELHQLQAANGIWNDDMVLVNSVYVYSKIYTFYFYSEVWDWIVGADDYV